VATYKHHKLYHAGDDASDFDHFFYPNEAGRVRGRLDLDLASVHRLRIQCVTGKDWTPSSTGTAPSGSIRSLADVTNILVGIKSALADADYQEAWLGLDTTDTDWYSLANGRVSVLIAPTITAGSYKLGIQLKAGSTNIDLGWSPLDCELRTSLNIGTEPSAPVGVSGNTGTATIASGSDNVVVTDANMTTGGIVIPSWLGSPQSTLSAVCAAGSFTITAGGPVVGNTSVGYYIARRSA
jgi:hypothetical protein